MAPSDPFATFDRVLQKYRRDVHQLADGARADAIAALESHLGQRLPAGLRELLARHNGGEMFRGSLRLRSTSEMAVGGDVARAVVLFADQPDGLVWAFGRNHDGRHAFGTWDGDRLEPQHATFEGWFDATLEVLDARAGKAEDRAAIRYEADADDPWQLLHAGMRALHAGRPEDAAPLLDRATQVDPTNVLAWQRLGDALAVTDRVASRRAWLAALHQVRLPLPWPGAPIVDPEVFASLARTFPEPEQWERELERLLEERVHEVRTGAEFDLLTTATQALADSLARRGKRTRARDVLADMVTRSTLYEARRVPWALLLSLAALDVDLGHHDEAEKHVRRLRLEGPPHVHGPATLLLARLVVTREEPWAEEILDEAFGAAADDDARIEAALLRVERAVRQGRREDAHKWVDTVRKLVAGGAPRLLRARAALAEADVASLVNPGEPRSDDVVRDALRRALDILGDRPAPEVKLRIDLRLGDLARANGDRAEAALRYRTAAAGFAAQELPLREAWALIRLAQVAEDPSPILGAARARFLDADLAAGVAAADSLFGNPASSLPWHLDRATDHARARHNAQRGKPPWHRADAERPERRIGAHRMAIAACHDDVVDALTTELDAAARAIRSGRGRPLDPPVVRYIAAVDLLAAHRSYPAANVLMRHLVDDVVTGVAQHALFGAIARSPNAALVDGLLQCVERPTHIPPAAVATAAEVLGLRREREATRPLLKLAAPEAGPLIRKAAIVALGRIHDRVAVDAILPALDEPTLAEPAALALLMLGERRGIDFHARALSSQRRDLSGHPGEIVGRYGGPSHLLVLTTASRSAEPEVALGALQGLGLLGDARGVEPLLEAIESKDRARSEVASGAMSILTGHTENLEEPGYTRRWKTWWDDHGDRFPKGMRHRDGRVFDAGLLLEKMEHDDPWVRRTAYDELVITSGEQLPFDSDGPWRVQQAHLRAWRGWWAKARLRMPAGRWYLHGVGID